MAGHSPHWHLYKVTGLYRYHIGSSSGKGLHITSYWTSSGNRAAQELPRELYQIPGLHRPLTVDLYQVTRLDINLVGPVSGCRAAHGLCTGHSSGTRLCTCVQVPSSADRVCTYLTVVLCQVEVCAETHSAPPSGASAALYLVGPFIR